MRAPLQRAAEQRHRHITMAVYRLLILSCAVTFLVVLSRFSVTNDLLRNGSVYVREEAVSVPQEHDAQTPSSVPLYLTQSNPRILTIEKLNLHVVFEEPVGLDEQGEIGVPKKYDTVSWYSGSPTPGEIGPSVVLGHVDSYLGPAVFFSLGRLIPGDRFSVERADGTTALFEVETLERYPQDTFATERVYGAIDYAGIRLITCSGVYNRSKQRYSHNLVVYGRLIGTMTQSEIHT
jgi:sortase (surface protein transpeptidase)